MAKSPHEPAIPRYRGLTVAEWLTAIIGVATALTAIAGLAISWLTFENAKDTRDIKAAIANLTALATETHNLAAETKRQADAATGQLSEAKNQTKAISRQTVAITASADANVKSADAQKRAADIGASASRPLIALSTPELSGLGEAPDKSGSVQVHLRPQFVNVGGTAISTGTSTFVLFLGGALPEIPNYAGAVSFGGNEFIAVTHSTFGPAAPVTYPFSKEKVDEMNSHKTRVFLLESSTSRMRPACQASSAMPTNS